MAFSRGNDGAPGEIRTPDLRIRSPTLYPAELRARIDVTAPKRRLQILPLIGGIPEGIGPLLRRIRREDR